MNKKVYLLVIVAIIVTTLGETFSFVGGDHGFYQTVQDKCTKCHGDIRVQLSTSAQHSSDSCTFCHPKSAVNHTNTVPACQDCHNVTQKLNNTLEAHASFSSLGSEGCIACHTTYNTIINYSRPEYIEFTITQMPDGNWKVIDFNTSGTLNIFDKSYRNGGDHNWRNVSCKDCHQDIFDAVNVSGHAVVVNKNGSRVPYHSNANSTLEAWCRTCHNRNDAQIPTQQHAALRITCDECHEAYNLTSHPGNLYSNIKTVPRLYRSLVCIACKSEGWQVPNTTIHFRVHQEPYSDITMW